MDMDLTTIVRRYIATLNKAIPDERSLNIWDAEVLRRKIALIQFDLPVSSNDNFDVVAYTPSKDTQLNSILFNHIDTYVNGDVYKKTGITYTEYGDMTSLEVGILLDYMSLKDDISEIDASNIEDSIKDIDINNGLRR